MTIYSDPQETSICPTHNRPIIGVIGGEYWGNVERHPRNKPGRPACAKCLDEARDTAKAGG